MGSQQKGTGANLKGILKANLNNLNKIVTVIDYIPQNKYPESILI